MLRNLFRVPFWAGTTVLGAAGLLLIASIGRTQAPPPPGPPTPEAAADEPGMETLTQGPIHEAFANPADLDPTPGPVVPGEPPEPIAEEPPEYMPEGAVWIPGYWQWDDEREAYLWVTGVARVPPPNMQWVPGYFADADGGWQRVSGFWASVEEPEVEYRLTGPPETLETGPSSPAPSEEHFWVPGYWNYYDTGYRWHAGYWAPYVENWIWVPARWVWTPGGFVFCPGFWDHRMSYRGQMFAPVYFQRPIYTRPAFVYRPWCVIPTNNLFIHLWIRPRWNCYYFGNYYGPQFAQRGFLPWANLTVISRDRYFYDPFFSYARVHYHRQGIDYIGRVQGWHRYFAQHEDLRPPRTWRQQQQFLAQRTDVRLETQLVARTVVDVARRQDSALRLVRLDDRSFRTQRQHAERLHEFNRQRRQLEVAARTRGPAGDRRDDDRDRPGREGKAGSLVDRAEGKAGRDDKTGGGRGGAGAPRLTIPRDLVASTPRVGRDRDDGRGDDDRGKGGDNRGKGDDSRGKAGKTADRQETAPPPRPRPSAATVRDDDRGGKGKAGGDDRQPKGVSKAADRQETPPSIDRRDRGPGDLADRDDAFGRGKAGDTPGRGKAGGAARTPDLTPGPGREKGADRRDDDRPGVSKGKASGPADRGIRAPGLPGVGDSPRGLPGTERPGPTIPGASQRDNDRPGRAPGTTFGPRPSAGVDRPAGTITPGTINPDRLGPGAGRGAAPSEGRSIPGLDRGTPGAGRPTAPSLDRTPSRGPTFGGSQRAERPDTPRTGPQITPPGRGTDGGRGSSLVPRGNVPSTRPGSDNRGKGGPSRDPRPDRTEALRPSFDRLERAAPTAAMPRVQPRTEARTMPRIEPQREARPMPRIETARENRPAPRIETPGGEPSRGLSIDRGSREPGGGRPDARSSSADGKRGKAKGRD